MRPSDVTNLGIDGLRHRLRFAVDSEVIEDIRSILFDQAKNRMHSCGGLLLPLAE